MGAGTLGWGSRPTMDEDHGVLPGLELHDVHLEGATAQACTRSRMSKGRVLVRDNVCDRSDVMRSVMMRGRSPCLELRGGLGTIRGSDSEFRSTARAKFKVSKAVAIWEVRAGPRRVSGRLR